MVESRRSWTTHHGRAGRQHCTPYGTNMESSTESGQVIHEKKKREKHGREGEGI